MIRKTVIFQTIDFMVIVDFEYRHEYWNFVIPESSITEEHKALPLNDFLDSELYKFLI